jgi:hypothetical protein
MIIYFEKNSFQAELRNQLRGVNLKVSNLKAQTQTNKKKPHQ